MSTPTVYDVAARAGVSIATVSRFHRNPGAVRPETRDRVQAAVDELGYVPSGTARGLANRTTGVLGLCFPDFHDAGAASAAHADDTELMLYSDEVIRGMQRAAGRHGYALLLTNSREGDAGEQLAEAAGRMDGVAVLSTTVPSETLEVVSRRLPVVMLAGRRDDAHDQVQVANLRGQLELTRHLIVDHGLRRLTFVGGPSDSPDCEARFRGFLAAHREAGLPLPEQPHLRGDLTQAAGHQAVMELLDGRGERPQGVVLANDQMAVGALRALASRGIRTPEEMAVTGFDGIALSRLAQPALTTVRQPMARLGKEAVELLIARLRDRKRATVARLLPVRVVRRASCGCGA
ncbi:MULTISPECIES: LacI family DNA-binding transcriptional regulator [unclassified Streptomyces]|uniref:LacI family DNA-binding transcriptional regulator n=1 Tax=unclassified Streptomyces TaxID=2593676 RepID=UPI0037F2A239